MPFVLLVAGYSFYGCYKENEDEIENFLGDFRSSDSGAAPQQDIEMNVRPSENGGDASNSSELSAAVSPDEENSRDSDDAGADASCTWACGECTFKNPADATVCEMCSTARA